MLGIRVDANEYIATGHVMRCMSIARQVEKLNEDVLFIVSDDMAENLVLQNNFKCILINNEWNQKSLEIDKLVDIISQYNITKMLVDSYDIDYNYLYEINKHCKLIYIDDGNFYECPVDMIVKYSLGSEDIKDKYSNKITHLLVGAKYIPLREEFANSQITIKEDVTDIMLTTGGTDMCNVVPGLLRMMSHNNKMRGINIHVIVGGLYNNVGEIEEVVLSMNNVILHKNVQNMADIMKISDIAISAGGTTLAELCACGVPTICFSMADNQKSAKLYGEKNIMLYAGDIRYNRDEIVEKINDYINMLTSDIEKRRQYSEKAKNRVDGQGAVRIAKEIGRIL